MKNIQSIIQIRIAQCILWNIQLITKEGACGQGDEAHLFLGVKIQQQPRTMQRRGSLLVRRSILPGAGSPEEGSENGGSAAEWQPADSIIEGVEGSPASSGSMAAGAELPTS